MVEQLLNRLQRLICHPAWLRFLRARLAPGSYLGLQLTAGALTLLAASWMFGSIADEIYEHETLTRFDTSLAEWLHGLATPGLTRAMLLVSDLHDLPAMTIFVSAGALLLIWKRYWTWLLILLLTVPGGAALNAAMKHVFERARPQFDTPLITLTDYSFPSGHTCASTLFYGFIAALLIPRIASWEGRALAATAACCMVVLVAFSRLYLGAHFLSDVLAGFAEGVAWLALCLTATHTFVLHRAQRRCLR